jgi:ComF family protein
MRRPTLRTRTRHLWRRLERELLPWCCVFCGDELPAGRHLCGGCDRDLVRNAPACRACALPLVDADRKYCGHCEGRRRPFTVMVAPLAYTFPVDAAIRQFKFHRKLHYLPVFTELLCREALLLPPGIDAVQPVPLHRWRQMRRGFNQARELALPVARHLAVPLIDGVRRRRHTPYQSGLAAVARRRNLENAFVVRGRIEKRHVLLVDDVVTTGTTCRRIAALLKRHGVGEVSVLALARAVTDP